MTETTGVKEVREGGGMGGADGGVRYTFALLEHVTVDRRVDACECGRM